ncbi:unnamed protein product [Vitrella brassicaformis CCMP3155]|uniref:Uncharacterized protein n=1 Tax=Vitrella brassicaformis (strain CCMP3155) TaxID=1169540 RepID=A0A0G4FMZ6_VITBC|nr:unnamed protein product [Vitrella brassicaformis CCMP3155]|mmetsp:Transcript_39009/g.97640  ORF Transcript_39009/g.97640 Transcript_39009/m.97640 type:complete len:242 (-) Transcript_39009:337-1062(-)|eukprot:CEM15618.1 unnamed protein product [Vitrella brassicaformis CCMP3155]
MFANRLRQYVHLPRSFCGYSLAFGIKLGCGLQLLYGIFGLAASLDNFVMTGWPPKGIFAVKNDVLLSNIEGQHLFCELLLALAASLLVGALIGFAGIAALSIPLLSIYAGWATLSVPLLFAADAHHSRTLCVTEVTAADDPENDACRRMIGINIADSIFKVIAGSYIAAVAVSACRRLSVGDFVTVCVGPAGMRELGPHDAHGMSLMDEADDQETDVGDGRGFVRDHHHPVFSPFEVDQAG